MSATLELLDERRHVLGPDRLSIAAVDCDDRSPAAAAGALDRSEGEGAVVGRLAGLDPELGLERLEHLLRPDERAGHIRADLDDRPPDGLEMEHVVERRDGLAVRGRVAERVGDLTERLRR